MYQGVTLGGTGFETGKRHPTGQDNVLPDPIADALKHMASRVAVLERELRLLRGEEAGAPAEVVPLPPARGSSPAGG
jgi:hypothetical protein